MTWAEVSSVLFITQYVELRSCPLVRNKASVRELAFFLWGRRRIRDDRKDIVLPLHVRHPVQQSVEFFRRERAAEPRDSPRDLAARSFDCFFFPTVIHCF